MARIGSIFFNSDGSTPDWAAALAATARLPSFDPNSCPRISLPLFTSVGCGDVTLSRSAPPPRLPIVPSSPPNPPSDEGVWVADGAALAATGFWKPERIDGNSAAAPAWAVDGSTPN